MTDREWIDQLLEKITEKMSFGLEKTQGLEGIPYTVRDGEWSVKKNEWWTNGFWGAEMWQMFLLTGDEKFRLAALRNEMLMDPALRYEEVLHHDVGFMWLIQSGVHYALEKDPLSYRRALRAANFLAGRFNPTGFIRAWNGIEKTGWAIIDCMMNLPVLYWASRVTGDPRYRLIAEKHADTTMKYFVREDGSCNHIVSFDPLSGEYLSNPGGQGMYSGSSWSRGQGWGLYGFGLSYRLSGKKEYLDTAKKIAGYILPRLGGCPIPKIDYCQRPEEELYDDAAAAITACGLLELAEHTEGRESALYTDTARSILRALEERDSDWTHATPAILTRCSECYLDPRGHHMAMTYADYFFIEAALRLAGKHKLLLWAPDL